MALVMMGKRLLSHIRRKYEYYQKKIQTTEEFVEYAATKSTMSRQRYIVYCEGQEPIFSSDWLMEELARFRRDKKNDSASGTEGGHKPRKGKSLRGKQHETQYENFYSFGIDCGSFLWTRDYPQPYEWENGNTRGG